MKKSIKTLITVALASIVLTGCNKYEQSLKILPNEIAQANECISTNKEYEKDCYDLISYKNSTALLRLGIKEYAEGNHTNAYKLYTLAKQKGNFYANALLSELYFKGKGVKQNQEMGLNLLKDVDNVDPIAAYKLSFYYLTKKEFSDAVELLEFAALNNVKDAQLKLSKIYAEGKITKQNKEKSEALQKAYEDKSNSFISKIYGL